MPAGTSVKSTIASTRWAAPSGTRSCGTGSGRKPPSLPICQTGSTGRAGRAVAFAATLSSRNRLLQPLSSRNR